MSKYILIDLEDTITIHNYDNRLENTMLKWLEFNNVINPVKIYKDVNFKNRQSRLNLLGVTEKEYEKWYKNFNEVEFNEYYKKYKSNQIIIDNKAILFLKNCKLPLILVSNSSPKWIKFILNEYNLTKKFKYIFYRDYSINDIKKPDSKIIDIIEKSINDKISNDSIVVGDSYTDYLFANNCNLKFIGMYSSIENTQFCWDFDELSNIINS